MFYAVTLKQIRKYAVILTCAVIALAACCYAVIAYPLKNLPLINACSQKYGLDPAFVCAVINAESRFDHEAVSHKGASGLMQLMKQTADWGAEEIGLEGYSYDKIFTPSVNIEIGCWYLAKLLNQYGGNEKTALAAYNAGSGNVSKWLSDERYSSDGVSLYAIPFAQTKGYVIKVANYKKIYSIILRIIPAN